MGFLLKGMVPLFFYLIFFIFFLLLSFIFLSIFVLVHFSNLIFFFFLKKKKDLKCDESSMTGESDVIKKNHDKDPFLLSGTKVRLILLEIKINK